MHVGVSLVYPPMVGVQVCTIAKEVGFMMQHRLVVKENVYIYRDYSPLQAVCPWKMQAVVVLSNI